MNILQIKNKERDSNIELLRIFSIFIILLLHANFKSIHTPTLEETLNEPFFSFFRIFLEFLCIIGVNVFILISGWYGIKPKLKRMIELLFQVIFFNVTVSIIINIYNASHPTFYLKEFYSFITLSNYWFVPCYIILYASSPIINMYIKHSNRKQIKFTILSLFVLQIIYGWLPSGVSYFYYYGYSPISFILLYLIGRYVSIYKPRFSLKSLKLDAVLYLLFSLLSSFLFYLSTKYSIFTSLRSILLYYTSPLIIIASLYLLLLFTKITIKSKIVNWIAVSSFAAYLFQEHHLFADVYKSVIYRWYIAENHLVFVLYTLCWIHIIFFLAILLDKIRIYIWQKISYKVSVFIEKGTHGE